MITFLKIFIIRNNYQKQFLQDLDLFIAFNRSDRANTLTYQELPLLAVMKKNCISLIHLM